MVRKVYDCTYTCHYQLCLCLVTLSSISLYSICTHVCSHFCFDSVVYYFSLYFSALNRLDVKDTDINNITDIIVDSLFSVFVTAGTCVCTVFSLE